MKHATRSEHIGIAVYASPDALVRWLDVVDSNGADGDDVWAPRSSSVSFERQSEVSRTMREKVKSHGLRLAGQAAFPEIITTGPALLPIPPRTEDIDHLELGARAVTAVFDHLENERWDVTAGVAQAAESETHIAVTLPWQGRDVEFGITFLDLDMM